jgi:hypothetical protein
MRTWGEPLTFAMYKLVQVLLVPELWLNRLRVLQTGLTSCSMWRNVDSPVQINLLHMGPFHHERHGQKP